MTSPCPLCGAEAQHRFATTDRNRQIPGGPFHYYQCRRCQTVFCSNAPSDLSVFYPKDYYTLPASREELRSWAQHERFKIEFLTRFIDRGRLVEVGPANGGFALLAQERGFQVAVIERDRRCAEFIQRTLAIPVVIEEDEVRALASLETADVIALWQVVEHLPNPVLVLQTAAQVLRPGGILLIATPNPLALQFRIFGKAWVHVDAPRHLVLMPAQALAQQAAKNGFEAIQITARDEGSRFWNLFGWQYSIMSCFRDQRLKRVARAAGTALSTVLAPVERVDSLATSYTAIFRRVRR